MSEVTDINKIVVSCQKGERSAQKALYDFLAPKMFGVCLRYAPDYYSAEDFLQDGFIRVFEKIDKFRFEGSFEGWMRRIMVNMIIESYRKTRLKADFTDDFPDDQTTEQAEMDENVPPSLNQLLQLVQQLPERYRMVFNLYVLDELTHDEIASRLGISAGTSKSNLSRARKWLQNRLKETGKRETVK